MKKFLIRGISIICSLIILFTTTSVFPVVAVGTEGAPDASIFTIMGEGLTVSNVTNGARLTFNRETPAWSRAYISKKYSLVGEGLEIGINDIASVDPDYSIALKFSNNVGWYDQEGYAIVYGNSGDLSIVWMDGVTLNPNEAKVLISDKVKPLDRSISLKIKYQNDKYDILINEKEYTITSSFLKDPQNANIVFSAFGDGDIKTLNWDKDYKNGALGYTVSKIVNSTIGESYKKIGNPCNAADWGMNCIGGGIDYNVSEKGIQIAFTNSAPDYARTGFESPYVIDEKPMNIVLTDFYSADSDYSIVVRLGKESVGWYDQEGYFLVFGKSGNFSIIWADGKTINPNLSTILLSSKLSPLGEKLELQVALNGESYDITVNGKVYSITNKYMEKPDELYLSFGAFCDGNIKTLNFQKNFFLAAVSFVIAPETYTPGKISARTFKLFADTVAFMKGTDNNNFSPKKKLTIKDAIVAIAKLIVDKKDIEGVYTSDFKNLKSKDKDYDYVAFMERCGFLPEFDANIKLTDPITREKFIDLLLDFDDVDEGLKVSDISSEEEIYGKICFAVNKGLLTLDSAGNFKKDDYITREEAAKAICQYIGKTQKTDNIKNTFSDVKDNNKYYNYILLATNTIPVFTKTLIADSKNDIQQCINEAILISKEKNSIITIELKDDEYKIEQPIVINGSEYGKNKLKLIIKSSKDNRSTISGNIDLKASDFKKVSGKEYYSYQLPADSKTDGKWPEFRDVYLNGEKLQIARSDDYIFEKSFRNKKTTEDGAIESFDNWIYTNPDIFKNINNDNLDSLEIYMNVEWLSKIWHISKLHGIEEKFMQLSIDEGSYNDYVVADGNKVDFIGWSYYFQNHIELLDEPGEFYYDSDNGIIFVYPYKDTNMDKSVVSYPAVEMLFNINKCGNISFDSIIFTGTTSNWVTKNGYSGALGGVHAGSALTHENIPCAAIFGQYTNNISINNCTFTELGTNGIYLKGGNNGVIIRNSSFTNLSMCAAAFGKNFQDWNKREGQQNYIIYNNYVYNIGTDYNNSPAFHCTRTYNIAFTHNTIIHTPYSGLMLGWINRPNQRINVYNAEVAYNHCEDNLYACNDGSPLYFGGANSITSDSRILNRVHDNFCKSTGYKKTYNGTYLDMNTSNFYVYNNVYEGYDTVHGPVFNQDHFVEQYTYNNTVSNNYSTVRHITSIATPERNIRLFDNKQFATSSELPAEAIKIEKNSGINKATKSIIPVFQTEVSMSVEEPHIKVPLSGKSEKNAVTFTIKNNSNKKSTYSVVNTNNVKNAPEIVSSKKELVLDSGKTGEITLSFIGGEKIVRDVLLDFAVVKDNGWKRQFKRVIDIDVVGENQKEAFEIKNYIIPIIVGGVALLLIVALFVLLLIKKKRNTR